MPPINGDRDKMSKDSNERKTFKKIEGGMIYLDDEGEVLFVGLPKKIKESTRGKAGVWAKIFEGAGAEVDGQKDTEIEYHWVGIRDGFPSDEERSRDLDSLTVTSCTVAASSSTAVTPPPPQYNVQCTQCNAWNYSDSFFCAQCGHEL